MTVLIVLLIIAAVLIILLNIPVKAVLDYNDKLDFKVKYLFFTIYPRKKKPEKPKKKSVTSDKTEYRTEKASDSEAAADKPERTSADDLSDEDDDIDDDSEEFFDPDGDKKEKSGLSAVFDKIEEYKPLVRPVWEPLKKLLKTMKITGVDINIIAADEDAYEAAMLYGNMNTIVYNVLALTKLMFKVKIKSVNIGCRFNYPKTYCKISFKAELTPARIIACAAVLLYAYYKFTRNKVNTKENENGH